MAIFERILNTMHYLMRILFYFPGNPLNPTQGNNVRALSLLKYFKSKSFKVDFVAEKDKEFSDAELLELKKENLIANGYLLTKQKKGGLKYFFQISIPKLFSNLPKPFDRRQLNQQKEFSAILKREQYDVIIISYSCWIPLILDNKNLKGAKIIVDTHDFLTAQFQSRKDFKLGDFFQAEMKLLNSVDQVWSISTEEKYLFEQFLQTSVSLVPHIETSHFDTNLNKSIDILYVASENEHNIKAAKWFFKDVYPNLPQSLNITIVGKIVKHIDDYNNVNKIEFVEDLSAIYSNTKVVICPMQSGTGLKIKVVEALSYGIPVVCNEKGVDGLINKTHNGCLVTDNPETFSQNITRLLDDKVFYEKQKNEAMQFFNLQLSEEAIYRRLDSIFNSITK